MNILNKILWAILAGVVALWLGGGTRLEATDGPPAPEPPLCDFGYEPVAEGCVPTTSTLPPTINEPVIPPSTIYPRTDDCLQHIVRGPSLPEGSYILTETHVGATGTTRWSIMYCAPIPTPQVEVEVTSPVAEELPTLPDTGTTNWQTVAAGVAFVLIGLALRMARR